jgi:hypothetical protein
METRRFGPVSKRIQLLRSTGASRTCCLRIGRGLYMFRTTAVLFAADMERSGFREAALETLNERHRSEVLLILAISRKLLPIGSGFDISY